MMGKKGIISPFLDTSQGRAGLTCLLKSMTLCLAKVAEDTSIQNQAVKTVPIDQFVKGD
jgi:hypothetical protein